MIEICNTFHLLDPYKNIDIKTFHLAEGPGGFIEAMVHMRQNPNDTYYGMTLIDVSNSKVPRVAKGGQLSYKKSKYHY